MPRFFFFFLQSLKFQAQWNEITCLIQFVQLAWDSGLSHYSHVTDEEMGTVTSD